VKSWGSDAKTWIARQGVSEFEEKDPKSVPSSYRTLGHAIYSIRTLQLGRTKKSPTLTFSSFATAVP
jgi:hypothetical protein